VKTFFSTAIMSGSALAGLVLACLAVAEPAEAKRGVCHTKYQGCQSRCFRKHDDPFPCINRTCNVQFDNCEAADRGGGRRGFVATTKQAGPHTPRPFANRPLESGGMKPKQIGPMRPGRR
jgi:hypothetical protein